jgi:hypothetical protein
MTPEEAIIIIKANWPPANYTMLTEALITLINRDEEQARTIRALKDALIKEKASKRISQFCNCEKCWPMGSPKPQSRIDAEEKVRELVRLTLAQ